MDSDSIHDELNRFKTTLLRTLKKDMYKQPKSCRETALRMARALAYSEWLYHSLRFLIRYGTPLRHRQIFIPMLGHAVSPPNQRGAGGAP